MSAARDPRLGDRNVRRLLLAVGAAVREYNRTRPAGAPPAVAEVRALSKPRGRR